AVETENAKPTEGTTTSPDTRAAMDTIVREELALLTKVQRHLAVHRPSPPPPIEDYEEQLISLRDQIASAHLEDVPALEQQMQRIAGVAQRRAAQSRGAPL